MSYSIDEGVRDAEKELERCREVRALYPDAHLDGLPGGHRGWFSKKVTPTAFAVVCDERHNKPEPMIVLYASTPGGACVHVYPEFGWPDALIVFHEMAKKDPALCAQLLAFIVGMR